MLYDSKKKLLGVGDAWPKPIKTGKGKHTLLLQVRAEAATALESLCDMPVHISRSIKSAITISSYSSKADAGKAISYYYDPKYDLEKNK